MSMRPPRAASGRSAQMVARACARAASRIIREGFAGSPGADVRFKGRGNVVTQTDFEVERAILNILAREYPDHAILSEETAAAGESEGWLWVVDPLDGTRNYVSGIPYFCINIALCYAGEPLLALTYEPLRREEFMARRGGGAFLNGRPMHASLKESVQASVMGFDMGYNDARARRMQELISALWPGMQAVRIGGSAALGLAYAACGRYDLFLHHMLYPWDVAAGILLVREAGGVITDRDGGPITLRSEGVVAGGPAVHADFFRLAQGIPWRE